MVLVRWEAHPTGKMTFFVDGWWYDALSQFKKKKNENYVCTAVAPDDRTLGSRCQRDFWGR